MKIRIQHMLVYLPPGSPVVVYRKNIKLIEKGELEGITTLDGMLRLTIAKVTMIKGEIDPGNKNFRDPDSCIKPLGSCWIDAPNQEYAIPDSEFCVTDLGQGRVEIKSLTKFTTVIFFPNFSYVPT